MQSSVESWLNSVKSSRTVLQPAQRQSVDRLLASYPTVGDIMKGFMPSMQLQVATSGVTLGELAMNKDIPTLRQMAWAYGERSAVIWLKVQLITLNDFAEVGKGFTEAQIEEEANLILGRYGMLNLCEFLLFIHKLKMADYGNFFGVVGSLKINEALHRFYEERIVDIDRWERKQDMERISSSNNEGVTYNEYLQLKKEGKI